MNVVVDKDKYICSDVCSLVITIMMCIINESNTLSIFRFSKCFHSDCGCPLFPMWYCRCVHLSVSLMWHQTQHLYISARKPQKKLPLPTSQHEYSWLQWLIFTKLTVGVEEMFNLKFSNKKTFESVKTMLVILLQFAASHLSGTYLHTWKQ